MERALKHKYSVGETVYFTASNVARPAATGTYEVIRLLPTDGDDCQYRIKSSTEAFERVAKESQLDISKSCAHDLVTVQISLVVKRPGSHKHYAICGKLSAGESALTSAACVLCRVKGNRA